MTPRRAPVGIVRADAPRTNATPSQAPMALAGISRPSSGKPSRRRTRRQAPRAAPPRIDAPNPPRARLRATARCARSGAGDGLDDIGRAGGCRRRLAGASDRRARRRPARARRGPRCDAATNPSNSGCGRSGRDLNSGWNWLATNHGWSLSSTISTSRPSGDWPDSDHAGRLERLAIAVVDLEAVAMALVDDLLAVDRGGLRAGRQLAPGRGRGASCRPCPPCRAGRA